MLKRLLCIICLLPLAAMGQYRITGKIVDHDTKKPVADASVFLSNASAGAKAGADGGFVMNGVRGGRYELVITVVGYTTYRQTILVNKDIDLSVLELTHEITQLKEVRIGKDKHWAEHYALFKREFLGSTDNAQQCDILNPHVLVFDHDTVGALTASASAMLVIVNKALGYKISYLLSRFSLNSRTGYVYYDGTAFFEDLPGKPRQVKKWKSNRQAAYLGSSTNFLRSLIAGRVAEEGFTVQQLIRKPNPAYKGGADNKYIATLVTELVPINQYYYNTDVKGEYAIAYKDCLYITYNKEQLSASIVTITKPYAFFDNNGIVLNPMDVINEGAWGVSRMAELLPVDYEPGL
jgi:hypothetical protein